MDRTEWRVRPGFLLSLLVIFVVLGSLMGVPDKTKSKINRTRTEVRLVIAPLLREQGNGAGGLTNINTGSILNSLVATNANMPQSSRATRTNALGEVTDIWETAYQFKIIEQTGFIIRSAGPNKRFGDTDDIVFNIVSDDFVKP